MKKYSLLMVTSLAALLAATPAFSNGDDADDWIVDFGIFGNGVTDTKANFQFRWVDGPNGARLTTNESLVSGKFGLLKVLGRSIALKYEANFGVDYEVDGDEVTTTLRKDDLLRQLGLEIQIMEIDGRPMFVMVGEGQVHKGFISYMLNDNDLNASITQGMRQFHTDLIMVEIPVQWWDAVAKITAYRNKGPQAEAFDPDLDVDSWAAEVTAYLNDALSVVVGLDSQEYDNGEDGFMGNIALVNTDGLAIPGLTQSDGILVPDESYFQIAFIDGHTGFGVGADVAVGLGAGWQITDDTSSQGVTDFANLNKAAGIFNNLKLVAEIQQVFGDDDTTRVGVGLRRKINSHSEFQVNVVYEDSDSGDDTYVTAGYNASFGQTIAEFVASRMHQRSEIMRQQKSYLENDRILDSFRNKIWTSDSAQTLDTTGAEYNPYPRSDD